MHTVNGINDVCKLSFNYLKGAFWFCWYFRNKYAQCPREREWVRERNRRVKGKSTELFGKKTTNYVWLCIICNSTTFTHSTYANYHEHFSEHFIISSWLVCWCWLVGNIKRDCCLCVVTHNKRKKFFFSFWLA